jgi:hypothetical protein
VGGQYAVALDAGQQVGNRNFGNWKPGCIGGYKWNDLDGDGTWDAGEPALSGWTINLGGAKTASTTTNANGYYEFTGLGPGNYTVSEVLQAGWTQTWPVGGQYAVALDAGQQVGDRNFGNWQPPVCREETAWAQGTLIGRNTGKGQGGGNWAMYFTYSEGTVTKDLLAGKTEDVGDVTVYVSGSNLVVEYATTGGWTLTSTRLYVGTTKPTASNPGSFPYSESNYGQRISDTSVVYTIPLSEFGTSRPLYIAAHAVVQNCTCPSAY